jgi:hypothetical protein
MAAAVAYGRGNGGDPLRQTRQQIGTAWLLQLLERRSRKVAAIALADKMARIIWAMMARGEAYRRQPVAA